MDNNNTPAWANYTAIDGAGKSAYEYPPDYDPVLDVWVSSGGTWHIIDPDAKTELPYRETCRDVKGRNRRSLGILAGEQWRNNESGEVWRVVHSTGWNERYVKIVNDEGKTQIILKRYLRAKYTKV